MLIMKKTNEASTLPRYKSQGNMHLFAVVGEINTGKSTTQPNLAYTPKEMYQRMTRGVPVMGEKFPVFDDEGQIPVPDPRFTSKLSLSEMQAHYRDELDRIRERNQKRIQDEKARLERERKAAKLKADQDREAAINKLIAQENANPKK